MLQSGAFSHDYSPASCRLNTTTYSRNELFKGRW
nr:MAG TPA: hypothetical protein [Caudoviricetes sp.]